MVNAQLERGEIYVLPRATPPLKGVGVRVLPPGRLGSSQRNRPPVQSFPRCPSGAEHKGHGAAVQGIAPAQPLQSGEA